MTQGFNPALPQYNGPLSSQGMRAQLLALDSCHEGPLPPQFPRQGKWWLDTGEVTEYLLKMYFVDTWYEVARYNVDLQELYVGRGINQFSVDFWEGNNPPFIASVDAYNFDDAAGFPEGQDCDVIFKLDANFKALRHGALLTFVYTMSKDEWAKAVNLRLDYRVHAIGERFDAGTPYDASAQAQVIHLDGILALMQPFQIPDGHINENTVEVECRLTRLGSSAEDTHTGDLGLKHVLVTPL